MAELFKEVLHEITGKPLIFIVEIIQFAVLIGIFILVVPRIVGKRLKERRERIIAELQEATKAKKEYIEATKEADTIVARAKEEARQIVKAAKENARREREAAVGQAEQEAKDIILQAEQTIETEKNKVINEACEQLVSLVTATTRRFLDEALTESERRALTQKIILSSLEEIESVSLP
ncbi:MAG: ATP synthase F0 subunit B [Actinomycetota bacterium]